MINGTITRHEQFTLSATIPLDGDPTQQPVGGSGPITYDSATLTEHDDGTYTSQAGPCQMTEDLALTGTIPDTATASAVTLAPHAAAGGNPQVSLNFYPGRPNESVSVVDKGYGPTPCPDFTGSQPLGMIDGEYQNFYESAGLLHYNPAPAANPPYTVTLDGGWQTGTQNGIVAIKTITGSTPPFNGLNTGGGPWTDTYEIIARQAATS